MRILVDGLPLFLDYGQSGDYSRCIINNLIKYNDLDLNVVKDYEIKSNLYSKRHVDLFLDRINDDFSNLIRYISKNDISIFHCLNNGFSIPKNYDFNYVMNVCNLIPFFLEEFCNSLYLENYFNKLPYGILKSSSIICSSMNTKKDLLSSISMDEKNIYVNYGTISSFFVKMDEFMSNIYIKSRFDIEDRFIIFFGDFNKRKRLDMAIMLFNKIRSDISNLKFLICSNEFKDTEYLDELKNLCLLLGISSSVLFLSNLSILDKVNLFNVALFFIDLSLYENINLNIVEAFSCELPIVCSKIGLYEEYFGEYCFYYDEDISYLSVISFANSYDLFDKEYVIRKFERNFSLKSILNVYNQTLKNKI